MFSFLHPSRSRWPAWVSVLKAARVKAPAALIAYFALLPQVAGLQLMASNRPTTLPSTYSALGPMKDMASKVGPMEKEAIEPTNASPEPVAPIHAMTAGPNATVVLPTQVTSAVPSAASVPYQAGVTYQWTITNGAIVSGANSYALNFTPGSAGSTLTVSCQVTDGSGTVATGTASAAILAAPTASLSVVTTTIPAGASTTMTPFFSNGTALIDNGVGAVMNGTTVTVTPNDTTTYTLTSSNGVGGIATASVAIFVVKPDATIVTKSPITAAANGLNASVPSVSGSTYQWSITNGAFNWGATSSTVSYSVGSVGTTTLTCKVTSATGVSATASYVVSVIPAPVIMSLTASSLNIQKGQATTLTAVFAKGTGVINNGVGGVTSGQAIVVSPTAATTYTLTVTNASGTAATQSLIINIQPDPSAVITAKSPVTTATVYQSASVPNASGSTYLWTITNGTINAGATSSTLYYTPGPVGQTTLSCKVTNSVGIAATGSTIVNVVAPPAITSFTASAPSIPKGQSATLTPVFSNGTAVLDNGIGGVASGQAIMVSPVVNTTYTLNVTNGAGTQSNQSLSVAVASTGGVAAVSAKSPVTTAATYQSASVPNVAGSTYQWSITNGTITYGATGSFIYYTAGPVGQTVLTCIVTPSGGVATAGSATVNVIAAPVIASFTASKLNVQRGQSITLTPVFSNGTATVDNGIGGVASGQVLTVSPTATTNYFLYVTNAAGTQVSQYLTVNLVAPPSAPITANSPVTAGAVSQTASVPNVSGATYQWSITNGTITYGATGTTIYYTAGPVGPTTLSCTLTNAAGVATTSSATINVIPAPVITSFTMSPVTNITNGQSATLTGVFSNGTGTIDNGVGGVVSWQGVLVKPTASTTYALWVTNAAGTQVLQILTVSLVADQVAITPQVAFLPFHFNQLFLASTTSGLYNTFTWKLREAAGGSLTQGGVYTAPNVAGIYHVDVALANEPTKTDTATVTVPLLLEVQPEWARVRPGVAQQFVANVTGTTNTAVLWSVVEGISGGSITDAGLYTAPATPGVYHVLVSPVADFSKAVRVTVEVTTTAQIGVSVSPNETNLNKGGATTFTATVSGTANTGVTWTATGGTVDSSGHYTAPNAFGTYVVRATSVLDSTATAVATVTVSALAGTDKAFSYDENGNLTSDGARTFEWDAENRLVAVTIVATGHRSEFVYDGLGRRVEILEKDNNVISSDQKFLWDGVEIAEARNSTGATVQKRFYAQGFVDTDGTTLYYTRDHLGSIRELTDASQAVRARYDYDPYGRTTKINGDRDSLFGFTGHYWHQASGLNLALFRAYDPNLGRWISRDPISNRNNPKMIDGPNEYQYALNSPVQWFDLLGLYCTLPHLTWWRENLPNTEDPEWILAGGWGIQLGSVAASISLYTKTTYANYIAHTKVSRSCWDDCGDEWEETKEFKSPVKKPIGHKKKCVIQIIGRPDKEIPCSFLPM